MLPLLPLWPLLLIGVVAWFFMRGRKRGASGSTNRMTGGVGAIRERTIAIGDTVLAVNNIGSIVILRGQPNYTLAIVGALMLLSALVIAGNSPGNALLLGVVGVALIVFNLMQKPDSGLSIGTCDGRSTLIVSNDEDFLGDLLDFIRRKVDTGDIKLQGRFDIGAKYFNSEGGGIVVGDHGEAHGRSPSEHTPERDGQP